ncbi:hypothetical protein F6R97_27270 [Pseudomonas sp. JV414]|uniref:hypothetical protein n=1 Tax=Pseudomonas sp. JV414 TaxID=1733110 RepID=UPI0028E168FC|nr:hypothetical protein [Pseudomonas sp. JV414]MDT9678217.1 hypothetical protein [Pseudomonas sp. JV414]
MNIENSIDMDRHLATKQIVHFLHLKQCALETGDKVEARRATDIIDRLTTEHGMSALHEAQERYK